MIYENPNIESSYKENNLGKTLYDLVIDLKPKKIIEFGALHGYSTVAMAMALEELGKGTIHSYDLWSKYPHKHGELTNTELNIRNYGLQDFVQLKYADFWEWEPEECCMFVLDVSNDGEIIEKMYEKMKLYAKWIVFEGGTKERDEVEWMKKYNKKPILEANVPFEVLDPAFPGISII